jgi:hypothetical protein
MHKKAFSELQYSPFRISAVAVTRHSVQGTRMLLILSAAFPAEIIELLHSFAHLKLSEKIPPNGPNPAHSFEKKTENQNNEKGLPSSELK